VEYTKRGHVLLTVDEDVVICLFPCVRISCPESWTWLMLVGKDYHIHPGV
jgi:hypothetical protein